MRKHLLLALLLCSSLGGCAAITAADEADDLKEASAAFADGLKAADVAAHGAREAERLETHRADVYDGVPVAISSGCRAEAVAANQALNRAIAAHPYRPGAADAAYAQFGAIIPCDFPGRQPLRAARVLDLPTNPVGPVMGSGSDTLSGTARRLEAYTEALADVTGGETAGKTDAARSKLVSAGKGLLGALKLPGPVDEVAAVAEQALSGIVAARRNRATRDFLNAMDPAMPTLMERVGLAARVQHGQAALNRARAAEAIADWGNRALNGRDMIARVNRRPTGTPARMALFDETAQRLQAHNLEFLKLTSTDPMIAARAFAEAHHQLTLVYNDPRANRAALAEWLGKFTEAATALDEALREAEAD